MNTSILFFILITTAICILFFSAAATTNNPQQMMVAAEENKNTLTGNWAINFNPEINSLREHLLTDMSGGGGGTFRITARFVSNDGTQTGTFHHELSKLIPSTCRSSPAPEFWERFGPKLIINETVKIEGNSISFSLRKISAEEGSIFLPGGRAQSISCGPMVREDGSAPTSRGFFFDPPSFSFKIEPAPSPSLVFLRTSDYFPYAAITYRNLNKNSKRADFDHIEIYANPQLGHGGMDFYVATIGNEFDISNPYNERDTDTTRLEENAQKDTEEDKQKKLELKKEIARQFYCSPAPCHMRLRNRTHNFRDFKEAQEFARANHFDTNNPEVTNTMSWFDGSEGEESQIIRPEDVTIIHAGMVRVSVSPTALFNRGFDILPLDDVQKTKSVPKKPNVYKFQLRHLGNKFLKVPHDHSIKLERLVYLTIEAPYAPAQNLRITYADERMSSYPLMTKDQGPLIVTDRCLASGFQFEVDEEVRGSVMPSFVHRCPMALIIHGDLLPSMHPLGSSFDHLFVPGRCNGQKVDCKETFFREIPPASNAWVKKRLMDDVKGFFVEGEEDNDNGENDDQGKNQNNNNNNKIIRNKKTFEEQVSKKTTSGSSGNGGGKYFANQEEGQTADQVVFPKEIQENLIDGNNNNNNNEAHQTPQRQKSLKNLVPLYPLASEEVLGINDKSQIDPNEWIQEFEFFSKGALRVRIRPVSMIQQQNKNKNNNNNDNNEVRNEETKKPFRVKKATYLSLIVHPSIIRNGRPSDRTENPMAIVVVPSHGIVTTDILSPTGDTDSSTGQPIVQVITNANTDSGEISINMIWRFDDYDKFSKNFRKKLSSKMNQNLVDVMDNSNNNNNDDESKSNDYNFPRSWTLFAKSDSGNEKTMCAEWMVQPAVAKSVIVNAQPTEKEIRLTLTFAMPATNQNIIADGGTGGSSSCSNIELSSPGFSDQWVESGKMPVVKSAKFKLINPV